MKHITTQLSLLLSIAVLIASCTDRKKELQQLAEENLRQSVEYPKQLDIVAVSEPNSAFGFSYLMDLAERQMRANSDIRQMLSQATGKKEWTGWKVKIDYQAVTHHGMKYNAERWFFISKDGKAVVRTFELPLP